MSANQITTTPTATPVPAAPAVSLSVTEPAAGEIKKFMSSEEGLPETAGLRLFVDMFSAQYLNGVEIDYVQNVMGSGFTFNNPNSTGSCGCGSSFTA